MTQVRIDIAALSAGRPDADGCQGLGDLRLILEQGFQGLGQALQGFGFRV